MKENACEFSNKEVPRNFLSTVPRFPSVLWCLEHICRHILLDESSFCFSCLSMNSLDLMLSRCEIACQPELAEHYCEPFP
ncbi:hypothetical protein MPTK1_4g10670 [Marchantia polymorpha subsp. ruderalis]|uniref:Uncharacterized protein n=2 Tax=Marchantia polymorpha TaxID=3197 RepID=A0AAF6B8J5_MARPO|nr:hypothetical protein MARPO_0011s0053 [Marchantia polymorpha]BBN08329.1 hypothetical protein Mp_4g10670 [Marchantia polymorpha subsp. ruderalis]|eukprot:PTQ46365.1 hypothetical protein MARPO_0011s0053 [Marchantia polymorpha]